MKMQRGKRIKNRVAVLGCAVFFSVISCEEDLAKVNSNKNTNFASQIIYNADIIQRDSGFVKIRFKAPLIEKYELIDSPYIVARKGMNLEFFDPKKPKIPGKISAKFAKYYEKKDFYEARGNVKIITNEGQSFAMQSIFWNKRKHQMYTSDTVFVTDKDGSTLIGANGMDAKDDFSQYVFRNNSGNFNTQQMSSEGK
jgi:LPS export ABC transporter protein LptC